MTDNTPFAAQLRAAIEKSGKPIREIARTAGLSYQCIHLLLSGRRTQPEWETVRRLAKAIGVRVGYFQLPKK